MITIRIEKSSYHGKRIVELSLKYGVSLNAASKIYLEDLNAASNLKESDKVPSRHTQKLLQPANVKENHLKEEVNILENDVANIDHTQAIIKPLKKSLLSEDDLKKVSTGSGIIDTLRDNLF